MAVEIQRATGLKQDTNIITASDPTTESLRTSEIRYRRLFESARDGILILNAATLRITDVNPFMTELLGYSREQFLGKELWEIGVFSDKEASQQAFWELQIKGYLRYEDLPSRPPRASPAKWSLSAMSIKRRPTSYSVQYPGYH